MTKKEFAARWAKQAAAGGAIEAFETDLEKLTRTLVRLSTSAVVNGLIAGTANLPKRDQDRFQKLIQQVTPAVAQALKKLYE